MPSMVRERRASMVRPWRARFAGSRLRGFIGSGFGLPEQVALAVVDADLAELGEVGAGLDALGDELGADAPAEQEERLDERVLARRRG